MASLSCRLSSLRTKSRTFSLLSTALSKSRPTRQRSSVMKAAPYTPPATSWPFGRKRQPPGGSHPCRRCSLRSWARSSAWFGALFFDKPPRPHLGAALAQGPDHRRPRQPPAQAVFCRPTTKAGVPHVEAPQEVLERMATARIHLDDVTEENGPLKVIPGSHLTGKALPLADLPPRAILVHGGDVLVMRPLLCAQQRPLDSSFPPAPTHLAPGVRRLFRAAGRLRLARFSWRHPREPVIGREIVTG